MKEEKTAVAAESELPARDAVSRALRALWDGLLYALWGYALSLCPLPFGTQPLGLGLLCAANRKIPYIFFGVSLAALQSDKPVMGVCAALVAVLVRILVRLTLDMPREGTWRDGTRGMWRTLITDIFSENISLRMATACLAAFMVGVYDLAAGGFLYYDLFGAIIGMLAAPLLVLALSPLYGYGEEHEVWRMLSYGLLAFFVVLGGRALTFFGVSVAVLGSMLLTLQVTRKHGMVRGMATGLLCGLAYSPVIAPTFALGALTAGALFRVSVFFACGSAFAVGMAWAFYAEGLGAVTGVLPALLAAVLLFAVVDRLFDDTKEASPAVAEDTLAAVACAVDESCMPRIYMDGVGQRVKLLCESFSAMSGIFGSMSERLRHPVLTDLRQICDNAFEACCANCAMQHRCWQEEQALTHAAIGSISATLHTRGSLTLSDVPKELCERCERMGDVVDEINYNSARYRRELLLCDKHEIFALDYAAIATMLAQGMAQESQEKAFDTMLAETLRDLPQMAEWQITHVSAYGKRRRRVLLRGADPSLLHRKREEIVSQLSAVCGAVLQRVETEEADTLLLAPAARFSVEYAGRTVSAVGESEHCGDTLCHFCTADDVYYSFLGDGMGSGREAALTSGICAVFLEKMLQATSDCQVVLQMLNGFLRHKGSGSLHECSATVDLMALDLSDGRVSFYKSGAAPTYVLREGSLFKLRSGTLPIGILQEADTKRIDFSVADGDVVIMVSDGITGGKEECPWLYGLLQKVSPAEDPCQLVEQILCRAALEGYGDDMSVAVLRVRETRGEDAA